MEKFDIGNFFMDALDKHIMENCAMRMLKAEHHILYPGRNFWNTDAILMFFSK